MKIDVNNYNLYLHVYNSEDIDVYIKLKSLVQSERDNESVISSTYRCSVYRVTHVVTIDMY